jgi:hypothetical protein
VAAVEATKAAAEVVAAVAAAVEATKAAGAAVVVAVGAAAKKFSRELVPTSSSQRRANDALGHLPEPRSPTTRLLLSKINGSTQRALS